MGGFTHGLIPIIYGACVRYTNLSDPACLVIAHGTHEVLEAGIYVGASSGIRIRDFSISKEFAIEIGVSVLGGIALAGVVSIALPYVGITAAGYPLIYKGSILVSDFVGGYACGYAAQLVLGENDHSHEHT